MRRFNVTGTCVATKHYMVDISGKLNETEKLVDHACLSLRSMDIVVDFEGQQIIVELKLWKGATHREKAYEQLLGYMESKNAKEGYLLTFDFRKEKTGEFIPGWVEIDGMKIFDVVV